MINSEENTSRYLNPSDDDILNDTSDDILNDTSDDILTDTSDDILTDTSEDNLADTSNDDILIDVSIDDTSVQANTERNERRIARSTVQETPSGVVQETPSGVVQANRSRGSPNRQPPAANILRRNASQEHSDNRINRTQQSDTRLHYNALLVTSVILFLAGYMAICQKLVEHEHPM